MVSETLLDGGLSSKSITPCVTVHSFRCGSHLCKVVLYILDHLVVPAPPCLSYRTVHRSSRPLNPAMTSTLSPPLQNVPYRYTIPSKFPAPVNALAMHANIPQHDVLLVRESLEQKVCPCQNSSFYSRNQAGSISDSPSSTWATCARPFCIPSPSCRTACICLSLASLPQSASRPSSVQ